MIESHSSGAIHLAPLFNEGECANALASLENMAGWRFAGDSCGATRVLNLSGVWRDRLATAVEQVVYRAYRNSAGGMHFSEAALVRYCVGATVPSHTDINPSKRLRVISFVFYLTDEYIGGELVIPGLNYRGVAGRGWVVTFPSTESHWAEQVVAGDKSVFVGFLESKWER